MAAQQEKDCLGVDFVVCVQQLTCSMQTVYVKCRNFTTFLGVDR